MNDLKNELKKLRREQSRLWWKCFRAQGVPQDYARLTELRLLIEDLLAKQKVIDENLSPAASH